VVTASFLVIPFLVNTVTTLVAAPEYLAEYQRALAAHTPVSPQLAARLAAIERAAADSPGQWRAWFWSASPACWCSCCSSSVMKGRWSPRAALRDQQEHDRRWPPNWLAWLRPVSG